MDNFITSPSNPKVKKVVELHRKKGRKQQGAYIVEGFHLIEEAIKQAVTIEALFIEMEQQAPEVSCPIYRVTADVMKKMATTETPQPLLGVVKQSKPQYKTNDNILYLDDLQDPGNIGTILRSAVAFGITHIVISPKCADLFDSKVVRSAQGAHFQLTYDVCDEQTLFERYQSHEMIVTTLDDATTLTAFTPREQWLLVVGNEGSGVKKSIQQNADARIQIEAPGMESLNVAVATSICLYEFTKK